LGCSTGISKSLFEIPIIGGHAAHSTQQDLGKQGMTMVVVTHEMGFARKVGTRVVFLDQGEIIEENTSEEFFANPQSDRAKDFLSKVFYE
jgi:polar amino acid transport system ATP-binding protein